MTYQGISTGTGPNSGNGDSLFDGAVKINSNFLEIYNTLGDGSVITFEEKVQDAIGLAITTGIQTGISLSYNDANNSLNILSYNVTTTSTNKILSNLEYCTVTSNGISLTLPENPISGNKVMIGIGGNYTNTIVVRNNKNIMGLSENMTINKPYITLTFIYINDTLGWRVS